VEEIIEQIVTPFCLELCAEVDKLYSVNQVHEINIVRVSGSLRNLEKINKKMLVTLLRALSAKTKCSCLGGRLVSQSVHLCHALSSQKMIKLAAVCRKETLKHQQKIQVFRENARARAYACMYLRFHEQLK
jgi:hypothetical protein